MAKTTKRGRKEEEKKKKKAQFDVRCNNTQKGGSGEGAWGIAPMLGRTCTEGVT